MASILVIDDESTLLELISTVLRGEGHQVTAMGEPLAACDRVGSGHLVVDLLLTDVDMKPINGFEIVARLRSKGFTSPVLFMSGYTALSGLIDGSASERAILEKPFTATALRAAVGKALATSQHKNSCAD